MTFARQLARRTALLLAFLCLWLNTGNALHHSDDLSALRVWSVGNSTVRHALPAAAVSVCTACEWEQSAFTPPPPALDVPPPPSHAAPKPAALPAVLHLRAFAHTSLRAPPITLL